MPVESKVISIDKYVLWHTARGNAAVNFVNCYDGGSLKGQIWFYPEGQVPESKILPTGLFSLSYGINRFQDIIATLRYEKPIYILLYWDAKNVITAGYVTTSAEPIGEQEGA